MKKTAKVYKLHNSLQSIILVPIILMILALINAGALVFYWNAIESLIWKGACLAISVLLVIIALIIMVRSRKRFEHSISSSIALASEQLQKLKENKFVKSDYSIDIREIQDIMVSFNGLVDDLANKVYLEKDISAEPFVEIRDEESGLLIQSSFQETVRRYCTKNNLYRAAVLAVKLDGAYKREYWDSLLKAIKKAFRSEIVGICDDKTILVLVSRVNSTSILKANCDYLITHFNYLDIQKETNQNVAYSALVGGAIFPYTSGKELVDVAISALKDAKPINIVIVEKTMNELILQGSMSSEQQKFRTGIQVLETMYKELGSIKSQTHIDDFIKKYLAMICDIMRLDVGGFMIYDPLHTHLHTYSEYNGSASGDCGFKKAGTIAVNDLKSYFDLFDLDGSFYGNTDDDLPSEVRKWFDNMNISSFYHVRVRNKHQIVALLYFNSTRHDFVMTNVERELMLMFTNLVSQCIAIFLIRTENERQNVLLNSLLKHSNQYVYMVDEKTYQLTFISENLLEAYPKMKIGNICYKAFHKNHSKPCSCCPLVKGRNVAVRPEIGSNLVISKLNYLVNPSIEAAILLEAPNERREATKENEIDPQLRIANRVALLNDFLQEVNASKSGYIGLIEVADFALIEREFSLEEATNVLDIISKRIQSGGYEECIYRYSDNTLALQLRQYKRGEILDAFENIYTLISKMIDIDGKERQIEFHMSAINYPSDMNSKESFKLSIDSALKESANLGANQLYLFGEKGGRSSDRKTYILDIMREAIRKDKIDVYLQPIMDINGKENISLEALLRLNDPVRGFIPPSEFVPIAAENGLMFEIEQANIRKVGELWKTYGFTIFKQSGINQATINISVDSINHADFVDRVRAECRKYRFPKKFLQFEIRESILKANFERVRDIINALSDYNISWSIDNYGLHQLTLEELAKIHIDAIKVDRTFVMDIESNTRSKISLTYMVEVAHKNNLKICSEGIERPEQLAIVQTMKFDSLQGYLFAKPMPVNEFIRYLNFGK